MPAGVRKYDLDTELGVLKAFRVIEDNKVQCGEATGVVDSATSAITLPSKCRRIIVTVSGAAEAWLSWGQDETNEVGSRIMVSRYRPAEFLLEKPEDEFFVRRVGASGAIIVNIVGVY